MNRLPILALAVFSLAACNKQGGERRQATGEILEGSVSDAMIHTDELRSEGPYAAPQVEKGAKGGKADEKSGKKAAANTDDTAATESAAPAPEPSSTPTPETAG